MSSKNNILEPPQAAGYQALRRINPELAEFARQVRAKTEDVNAAGGKLAEQQQAELPQYMGRKIQALTAQGLSIAEIQEALPAAVDDMVPQTRAQDAGDREAGSGGEMEPPACPTAYFLPLEEAAIVEFAAGRLDKKGMMGRLRSSPGTAALEMTEGLGH